MSRTYRRKKAVNQDFYWIFWNFREDLHWSQFDAVKHTDTHSKKAKKALARYHSDAQTTMRASAPREYCKVRHHALRQSSRNQIHKYFRDTEYEVQIDPNHHHSASWDYW